MCVCYEKRVESARSILCSRNSSILQILVKNNEKNVILKHKNPIKPPGI